MFSGWHAAGDQVWVRLAALLKQHFRCVDVLARRGGEEFTVMLPNTNVRDAMTVVEKLRERFSGSASLSGVLSPSAVGLRNGNSARHSMTGLSGPTMRCMSPRRREETGFVRCHLKLDTKLLEVARLRYPTPKPQWASVFRLDYDFPVASSRSISPGRSCGPGRCVRGR